jgi:UDP-glucose 4-epimerase
LRVLVAGGAGFVGSALVERLLAEGHRVDVVDDLSTGSLGRLADARRMFPGAMSFHQLDVRSPNLAELVSRCRPQVVYQLASRPGPAESVADPLGDAEANLLGSLRVLEAARRAGVAKVVFASGAAVYGEVDDPPATEGRVRRPLSPHGAALGAVEGYLRAYRDLHGLEHTVAVLGTVYGPGGERGVVGRFAARLAAGEPCTIYGDGSQTRDLVYIDDAVDALARAAERGGGLTLNVATGVETPVAAVYASLASAIGVDVPPLRAPARSGEPLRVALDPSRAAIHLGWRPWTSVAEGLAAVAAATSAQRNRSSL